MKVKLNRPLNLGGLTFNRGETVEVSPSEGRVLIKLGRVSLVEDAPSTSDAPTGKDDAPSGQEVKPLQVGTTLKDLGGGWYQLSNGEKVQGKEAAELAEKALQEGG